MLCEVCGMCIRLFALICSHKLITFGRPLVKKIKFSEIFKFADVLLLVLLAG